MNIAKKIHEIPADFNAHRRIKKIYGDRLTSVINGKGIDWATSESLALATLLDEGYGVRISGQDVGRGTFSHRHGVLYDQENENRFVPLRHFQNKQGYFEIIDSFLSEFGVLGFEYGYSQVDPKTLVIWEAQFGDFSNGAQIMIDQYLSSAEDKWKMQNGLVLFLPHGYEGQGAEHSSARMERYLQLCAKDNMFVADVTTPANLFHMLRRQLKSTYRKPLVVFTPKSLLRHPMAVSSKEALAKGHFMPLIDDYTVKSKEVKTLVLCTGKFYYDLLDAREIKQRKDVALVRLEQLFPLPKDEITAVMKKYTKAEVVWAQEEPRNMGAYGHLLLHLPQAHDFRVASRRFYGAPAAGSLTRSKRRHKEIIEFVFDKTKNNMR